MIKNLVIVESPAKAKTIEKFLGGDYTVTSCFGHIRDLAEDDLSIDVKNNFTPKYVIPSDKKKLVDELKKMAKDAEQIWLATDEDREGEAISWHLAEVLDLKVADTKRIVFHEITKPAILKAIESPRTIDENLVNAQQARRLLDRLVGYELSPVLWKKVKPSLSAGRVQSVAVRLIVEREREINGFLSKSSYKITAVFNPVDDKGKISESVLRAELPQRFESKAEAKNFLENCIEATYKIGSIEVKPGQKSPAPPFTTSTLQQEAARKLGMSVTRTMVIAQKLYEAGLITYMRTDSVNLSEQAMGEITAEIKKSYGENYSHPRKYTTKNESAQEAHEAIRPTYIQNSSAGSDDSEVRLYELIWKRTIASQMSNAKLERTNVKIEVSTAPNNAFSATGEVLIFDGFLKVYLEGKDDEDDEEMKTILPPIKVGQTAALQEMLATQRFNRPPARYTEAALVKAMEELGIGRPSTYAPTITTVQKRGYVIRADQEGEKRDYETITLLQKKISEKTLSEITGKEKSKLFPSNIGMLVNDFLMENFTDIMDYKFTATVEKEFDNIAEGGKDWQKMLGGFYTPFHENVEHTKENSDWVRGERHIGVHPENGRNVYVKMGKFGPHVQVGESTDEEKPLYAKLRPNQLLETITMEEALELFKLPRELGELEGEKVVANVGRFGPYIGHNKAFYSIPKGEDPYEITLNRALEIITEKRNAAANKTINEFEHDGKKIQVLNGRFGPYVAFEKINATIPKSKDPAALTLEECLELIEAKKNAPPKARGARFKKKS